MKLKSSRVEALEKEVVKLREQLYGKPKAAERSTVAAPGSVGFGSTVSARPLREVRLLDFPRPVQHCCLPSRRLCRLVVKSTRTRHRLQFPE